MAVKVEDLCQAVLELRDTAVGGGGTGKTLLVQGMECAANSIFVEVHDRLAVGFLIGGVQDGIQRERIVLGGGDLFFDKRAEDTRFGRGQGEVHGGHDTQRELFARRVTRTE